MHSARSFRSPAAWSRTGVPVVMLILDDHHAELMRIAAAQVRARGAYTVIITDKPALAAGTRARVRVRPLGLALLNPHNPSAWRAPWAGLADRVVTIPSNGPLTALLGVVPLQLLAYELSMLKGVCASHGVFSSHLCCRLRQASTRTSHAT